MSNFFASNSSKFGTEVVENTNQQFLRFYLDPDVRAMLPISQITEVLKIQLDRIVPIPQMPAWVIGVYNWRGDILWMVDLGHFLGLNSWYRVNRSDRNAIILSPNKARLKGTNDVHLGLVVSRVEDIEECEPAAIQSNLRKPTAKIASFASGYWLQPEGKIISVLDGEKIARAMPQSAG